MSIFFKVMHLIYGRHVLKRPIFGGVSTRSRSSAPSPQGCVVNGQLTEQSTNELTFPPPSPPPTPLSLLLPLFLAHRRLFFSITGRTNVVGVVW